MTVYDKNSERSSDFRAGGSGAPGPRPLTDREQRAGYRPGWVWVPVAAFFLLVLLVIGVGFAYGGYSDPTRAYDNGTSLEQTGGQVTQPNAATPFTNANPPEIGNSGTGEEPSSLPEAAPALANDGQ